MQTQPEREAEGSGAGGSKESVGLTTRTRRKTICSYTGVRTRRQKKKEDEEIGMEEEKDIIAANSRLPNHEEGEPENGPATGRLPLNLGEYIQNPTYSGNFNQITEPCQLELTREDEVRNLHFFWRKYNDKIVPDKPDNSKESMDSLGRIQNVQDPELRNKLQDPVKRSGIYAGVLRKEVEKASKEVILVKYDELKEKSEKDFEMLKDGKFEQYHEKSMKNMFEMVLTGVDAVVGMLVPKIGGSTEYNQTKIQESEIAINKLLVTVGDHEDRLTEVEQNVITRDKMITWTKSMQNPQEGVVVKNAPWAAAIIDKKTHLQKRQHW